METIAIITGLLILLALVFVIWQFIKMMTSKKIKKTEKGLWVVAFFVASLLTAIVWFIVNRK